MTIPIDAVLTGKARAFRGDEASAIGKTMAGKSGTANDNKAVSFIGFTPSTLTMFAIWNPGANGEALELPTINGYYKGMGYPAVLFTNYMSRALEKSPQPTAGSMRSTKAWVAASWRDGSPAARLRRGA